MYPNTPTAPSSQSESAPLTVSQLNHQARYLLENQFGHIQVTGEVSNLAKPASGHLYFTLKDASAQLKVALFRSRVGRFIPSNGDKIVVTGKISLYEPRGDYQMLATAVQAAGDGDLQQAFLRLKAQLEQEGLFDPQRKKAIPKHVQTIGVITSSSGAAIHDILTVLKRRFPSISVILYPVAVQGNEAGQQIANAISTANRWPQCDVLIVGRGGGSLEDLWAFNEEVVARAIVASDLPIVSAVGHEVDFTIADYAADMRAATPSAAAELLSPDRIELMQTFDHKEQQLLSAMQQLLRTATQQAHNLKARLRHPGDRVKEQRSMLGQLQKRLALAHHSMLQQEQAHIRQLAGRLAQQHPSKTIQRYDETVARLDKQLAIAVKTGIKTAQHQYQSLARALNSVSPLSTLERGYAIVQNRDGKALTSSSLVKEGEKLHIRLHDGSLDADVTHRYPKSEQP